MKSAITKKITEAFELELTKNKLKHAARTEMIIRFLRDILFNYFE